MLRRFSISLFFLLSLVFMLSSCDALEKVIPNNIIPCKDCPPPEGVFTSLFY